MLSAEYISGISLFYEQEDFLDDKSFGAGKNPVEREKALPPPLAQNNFVKKSKNTHYPLQTLLYSCAEIKKYNKKFTLIDFPAKELGKGDFFYIQKANFISQKVIALRATSRFYLKLTGKSDLKAKKFNKSIKNK